MRILAAIAVLSLALACWGCGDDAMPAGSAPQEGYFAAITDGEDGAKPDIDPPDRPPPKKLLVRDIEVGSGPVARRGDKVGIRYTGVNYKWGYREFEGWPLSGPPYTLRIGFEGINDAWEEGMEGMRVGGRRELIIPSHLLFNNETVDYVIDLVRIYPAARDSRGG